MNNLNPLYEVAMPSYAAWKNKPMRDPAKEFRQAQIKEKKTGKPMNSLDFQQESSLMEGGISRQIPRTDKAFPEGEGRDFHDKIADFLTTGHINPRKVAAVNLKRIKREAPDVARSMFRLTNRKGLHKLNPLAYSKGFKSAWVRSNLLPNSGARKKYFSTDDDE